MITFFQIVMCVIIIATFAVFAFDIIGNAMPKENRKQMLFVFCLACICFLAVCCVR